MTPATNYCPISNTPCTDECAMALRYRPKPKTEPYAYDGWLCSIAALAKSMAKDSTLILQIVDYEEEGR